MPTGHDLQDSPPGAPPPPGSILPGSLRAADHFAAGVGGVFGADDRRRVPDNRAAPWRRICALRIRGAGGWLAGTGWLISPRIVITAGHCVFLPDENAWAREIIVIPALDGTNEPLASARAERFYATSGWMRSARPDCDYGAILVPRPGFVSAGAFEFAALPDAALRRARARICGYPADLEDATHPYFHGRVIDRLAPHELYYETDTFGGQSGSPIWIRDGAKDVVVGIHTTGRTRRHPRSNAGVRIDDDVARNLAMFRRLD